MQGTGEVESIVPCGPGNRHIAEKHYSEENLALGNLALKRKPSIDVTTQ